MRSLKLYSLFAAWVFWTFHNKSHNMKALITLSHSWSPFLPLTKKLNCLGLSAPFLSIFLSKNSPQVIHGNHMTMTISGQIKSWPDYLMTKGNVNIKLLDLCESLIVYILLSTCQWVHMTLAVNRHAVDRYIYRQII